MRLTRPPPRKTILRVVRRFSFLEDTSGNYDLHLTTSDSLRNIVTFKRVNKRSRVQRRRRTTVSLVNSFLATLVKSFTHRLLTIFRHSKNFQRVRRTTIRLRLTFLTRSVRRNKDRRTHFTFKLSKYSKLISHLVIKDIGAGHLRRHR